MKINIVNKSNNPLPKYETSGASGLDLKAFISSDIIMKPLERKLYLQVYIFQCLMVLKLRYAQEVVYLIKKDWQWLMG